MNLKKITFSLTGLQGFFYVFIFFLIPNLASAQREILQLNILSGPVTFSIEGLGENGLQITHNAVSVQVESSMSYELQVVAGTSVFLDGVNGQSLPPSVISVSLSGENTFVPVSTIPTRLSTGETGTTVFNLDLSVQPSSPNATPAGRYQGELVFQVVAL